MSEYMDSASNEVCGTARQMVADAFAKMQSCKIDKKQAATTGRTFFLPCMFILATGIFAFCLWGTSYIDKELRYFLIPLISLIFAFFATRIVFMFVIDLLAKKHAETATYLNKNGKRYFIIKGRYMSKFEYEGGGIIFYKNGKYDKFENKAVYNKLASRFDKNLQRRSCSYHVLSEQNIFNMLACGQVAVGDANIACITEDGELNILFENGFIKRIDFVGSADGFYDSASPLPFLDTKLPFAYIFSYEFYDYNMDSSLNVPTVVGVAIKDFLLLQPDADAIKMVD